MTSPLKSVGVSASAPGYYSTRWRKGVESHLVELRKPANSDLVSVVNLEGYRTRFDFFAYLTQKKVDERWHWAILRMNGFKSPRDFTEDITEIVMPKSDTLQTLYSKIMK